MYYVFEIMTKIVKHIIEKSALHRLCVTLGTSR